ncbi:hypothetical protein KPH14_003424 [Odynerus spinipes]|uniref:Uncharacterized protein n=1 Tax=Odynerus spinipes TaxID=1348599 RepID=A0AAD9RCN3_9HYME|nr:hypothetical protein KPH14_003424 [Odynerus spinipes]
MNGARILDEAMKLCVKNASGEIKIILDKLHNELAICNKLAFRVIKTDGDKKSMLKEFMESAKQLARDAKHVIHVCTGDEQEAFFKCLGNTLRKMKAQRVENLKKRSNPEISPAEIDQVIACFSNTFTNAQTSLAEAEKRFKDCVKGAKG